MKDPESEETLLQVVNEARNRYEAAHLALRTITSAWRDGSNSGEESTEIRLAFEEQERWRVHLAEALEKLHSALSYETRPEKADPADL